MICKGAQTLAIYITLSNVFHFTIDLYDCVSISGYIDWNRSSSLINVITHARYISSIEKTQD